LGGLIKPRGEHSTPGTLKAVQVTLVKPVAYLKYRVSCWAYPKRSLTKAARTIQKHALHLASAFATGWWLCTAIITVKRCPGGWLPDESAEKAAKHSPTVARDDISVTIALD
jgi:hypothetical protein